MGVDFATCDDCGECTNDQNITYMDLEQYGSHKSCSICVKKYFTFPDPLEDEDACIELFEDAYDHKSIVFFCVSENLVTKDGTCSPDNVISFSQYASNARGWINEPESWIETVEAAQLPLCIGFYEAWKPVPEILHVYDRNDGMTPLFDACYVYDCHFKEVHGYSEVESFKRDNPKPNNSWFTLRKERLDAEIKYLQIKRQRLETM
jgi:hypothetical protein